MSQENPEENKIILTGDNVILYREIMLRHYSKFWGGAEFKVKTTRELDSSEIEVFYFPGNKEQLAHVATIGLFFQKLSNGDFCRREYFFTLAKDLGGESIEVVFNYMLDICAHTVTKKGELHYPSVTDETHLCPEKWKTKALLIDEARGEPEDFLEVNLPNTLQPDILWVVPIFQTECNFIIARGIEEFDLLCESMEQSVIDVTRDSFCS